MRINKILKCMNIAIVCYGKATIKCFQKQAEPNFLYPATEPSYEQASEHGPKTTVCLYMQRANHSRWHVSKTCTVTEKECILHVTPRSGCFAKQHSYWISRSAILRPISRRKTRRVKRYMALISQHVPSVEVSRFLDAHYFHAFLPRFLFHPHDRINTSFRNIGKHVPV
jgi:hypothetical protein